MPRPSRTTFRNSSWESADAVYGATKSSSSLDIFFCRVPSQAVSASTTPVDMSFLFSSRSIPYWRYIHFFFARDDTGPFLIVKSDRKDGIGFGRQVRSAVSRQNTSAPEFRYSRTAVGLGKISRSILYCIAAEQSFL